MPLASPPLRFSSLRAGVGGLLALAALAAGLAWALVFWAMAAS